MEIVTVCIFEGKIDEPSSSWTCLYKISERTFKACHNHLYEFKVHPDHLYYAECVSLEKETIGEMRFGRFGYADSIVSLNCRGDCDDTSGGPALCFAHPDFKPEHLELASTDYVVRQAAERRLRERQMKVLPCAKVLFYGKTNIIKM